MQAEWQNNQWQHNQNEAHKHNEVKSASTLRRDEQAHAPELTSSFTIGTSTLDLLLSSPSVKASATSSTSISPATPCISCVNYSDVCALLKNGSLFLTDVCVKARAQAASTQHCIQQLKHGNKHVGMLCPQLT
jgi:hypothetical protein